jgi:hypothetical protein
MKLLSSFSSRSETAFSNDLSDRDEKISNAIRSKKLIRPNPPYSSQPHFSGTVSLAEPNQTSDPEHTAKSPVYQKDHFKKTA